MRGVLRRPRRSSRGDAAAVTRFRETQPTRDRDTTRASLDFADDEPAIADDDDDGDDNDDDDGDDDAKAQKGCAMEEEHTRTSMNAPEEAEDAATIPASGDADSRALRAQGAFRSGFLAIFAPKSGLNAGKRRHTVSGRPKGRPKLTPNRKCPVLVHFPEVKKKNIYIR